MITFNNDEDRKNFQITMALQMLRQEVKYGHIVCDPRKGSTVRTLRRYWPALKSTRKGAYKQLVDSGIYALLDQDKQSKVEELGFKKEVISEGITSFTLDSKTFR
jgi:hypothetical protein